jgi:hypothetical protein
MKQRINEHDMTKKMMDILRGGYKDMLTEEVDNQKDTKDYTTSNPIYQEELKKIKETVDSSIEIDEFRSYINPNNKNVMMTGTMLFGKVIFRFELIRDEAELSTIEPYDLTIENNEKISKMIGYFKNWRDEWAKKITEEMKDKNN